MYLIYFLIKKTSTIHAFKYNATEVQLTLYIHSSIVIFLLININCCSLHNVMQTEFFFVFQNTIQHFLRTKQVETCDTMLARVRG